MKIELLIDLDFNGYWKDDYEGIQDCLTTDVVYSEDYDWGFGYEIVRAECEALEDVFYTDSVEHKTYYLENVNTMNDIYYPRTWSTEKPAKVEIVDWE